MERSWEELPAHPSHTNLAFMRNPKQQIVPGTCVVVGVKDELSKIPATPACACSLLAPTGPQLAGPRAAPSPWPHCNVSICQPGPHHSRTRVDIVIAECLTRTSTASTAWLSVARNYWGTSLVLQTDVVASGVLHPAVLPSTRHTLVTGLSPGKSCEDG